MIVKTFLIVSVASFNLAVMPRRSWTDKLMLDFVMIAKYVKGMYALGFGEMGKFCTIIRLNDLRCIAKEGNSTLDKINCGLAAVFLISVDESFS